jgi:prepilin-type N-terminal cleavage/methylation domain-containing protein
MRQRGFSLIELLVVVAIILIIAAIAIPNLQRSKMQANEASAVSSIRTINTAQITYAATYPDHGYADDLAKLGAPSGGGLPDWQHADILDWVLGCTTQPCSKSGYKFNIINATGGAVISGYDVTGEPNNPGVTGIRGFCSNRMNPILIDPSGGTNCTIALK